MCRLKAQQIFKFKTKVIGACLLLVICSVTIMNAQSVKTETRTINDSTYIDLVNPTYAPIEFRLSIKPAYIKYFKADSVVVIPPKSSLKNVVRYPSTYSIDSSTTILDFVDLNFRFCRIKRKLWL